MTTRIPIQFRDPPPPIRDRISEKDVEAFLSELAQYPGRWAVYRTGMKNGNAFSMVKNRTIRHPEAEWVARKEGNSYTVFVRIIAPK
jgi:hypothetical protein